jgi:hypothetical protein
MKTMILVLIGIALNIAVARGDDVHLVETAMYGDVMRPRGEAATNSIYVLLLPLHDGGTVHINPVVLRTFDAKEIGKILRGAVKLDYLPRGSVLHIDPSPVMVRPPDAEVKKLADDCKNIGVTVVVSETF